MQNIMSEFMVDDVRVQRWICTIAGARATAALLGGIVYVKAKLMRTYEMVKPRSTLRITWVLVNHYYGEVVRRGLKSKGRVGKELSHDVQVIEHVNGSSRILPITLACASTGPSPVMLFSGSHILVVGGSGFIVQSLIVEPEM